MCAMGKPSSGCCAANRRLCQERSQVHLGRRDDQGADHPEHPLGPLDVREDVAVERPNPWPIHVDDEVVAFAGVDAQRVSVILNPPTVSFEIQVYSWVTPYFFA